MYPSSPRREDGPKWRQLFLGQGAQIVLPFRSFMPFVPDTIIVTNQTAAILSFSGGSNPSQIVPAYTPMTYLHWAQSQDMIVTNFSGAAIAATDILEVDIRRGSFNQVGPQGFPGAPGPPGAPGVTSWQAGASPAPHILVQVSPGDKIQAWQEEQLRKRLLGAFVNVEDWGADPGASGASNAVAIQNAINAAGQAATADEAIGVFFPRIYPINNTITLPNRAGITLFGRSCEYSGLRKTAGVGPVVDDFQTDTIWRSGGSGFAYAENGYQVLDLLLDANQVAASGSTGCLWLGSSRVKVQGCRFIKFGYKGLLLGSVGGADFPIAQGGGNHVTDCYFESGFDDGVFIGSTNADVMLNHNYYLFIKSGRGVRSQAGYVQINDSEWDGIAGALGAFFLDGNCQFCTIQNNQISDGMTSGSNYIQATAGSGGMFQLDISHNRINVFDLGADNTCIGIDVGDKTNTPANFIDCTVSDNHIIYEDVAVKRLFAGIYIRASQRVKVHDNTIDAAAIGTGAAGAIQWDANAQSLRVRDNLGFTTEEESTTSVLAGTGSIVQAHGLNVTPNVILVTPRNDPTNDVAYWWVDNVGASTFKINVHVPPTNDLGFYWRAALLDTT